VFYERNELGEKEKWDGPEKKTSALCGDGLDGRNTRQSLEVGTPGREVWYSVSKRKTCLTGVRKSDRH